MNRPIDHDLDDRPRVAAMSREQLERGLVSMSRTFAEERTENRRLKRENAALLAALRAAKNMIGPHFIRSCGTCEKCGGTTPNGTLTICRKCGFELIDAALAKACDTPTPDEQ